MNDNLDNLMPPPAWHRGDNYELVYDSDGWRGEEPGPVMAGVMIGILTEEKRGEGEQP